MGLADRADVRVVPRTRFLALGAGRVWIAFTLAACLLGPLGYARMFSGFQPYDDEGIFLVALRDYIAGHPLMTPSVPLYGPFYYEVYGVVFKVLGIAPTHDAGRWLTLLVWLLASAGAGWIVWKVTRAMWLGLGAQLVAFTALGALTNEPTSTYGLSTLLLLALIGVSIGGSIRPRAGALMIGAIVAALALVKINLGVFAALAVAFAWVGTLPQAKRRFALPVVGFVVAAFPLALTTALWHEAWVLEFAVLVALSTAALGIAVAPARIQATSRFEPRWMLAGALGTVVACLAVAMLGGSRPADIFNFLFVFPLRFPQVFTVPLEIGPAAVVWAGLVFVAAVLVRRAGVEVPAAARIAAGAFTWLSLLLLPTSAFLFALPLSWLALNPARVDHDNPIDGHCRALLPALALLESLQAYPVAGTQVSLAAFGLIPIGAILIHDGVRQARANARAASLDLVGPALVVLNLIAIVLIGLTATSQFASDVPLGLSGAKSMRVSVQEATALRGIVNAIDAHNCTYVITYPGMDSFYIWTDAGSSIETRYGQWYLTVSPDEQRRLVAQLEHQSGVCVVKNQALLNFWTRGRATPGGPLVDYIDSSFVSSATSGDYELLVPTSS